MKLRNNTIDFRYRADTEFIDPTDEVYTGAGKAPTTTPAYASRTVN